MLTFLYLFRLCVCLFSDNNKDDLGDLDDLAALDFNEDDVGNDEDLDDDADDDELEAAIKGALKGK